MKLHPKFPEGKQKYFIYIGTLLTGFLAIGFLVFYAWRPSKRFVLLPPPHKVMRVVQGKKLPVKKQTKKMSPIEIEFFEPNTIQHERENETPESNIFLAMQNEQEHLRKSGENMDAGIFDTASFQNLSPERQKSVSASFDIIMRAFSEQERKLDSFTRFQEDQERGKRVFNELLFARKKVLAMLVESKKLAFNYKEKELEYDEIENIVHGFKGDGTMDAQVYESLLQKKEAIKSQVNKFQVAVREKYEELQQAKGEQNRKLQEFQVITNNPAYNLLGDVDEFIKKLHRKNLEERRNAQRSIERK